MRMTERIVRIAPGKTAGHGGWFLSSAALRPIKNRLTEQAAFIKRRIVLNQKPPDKAGGFNGSRA
jgi:hypothetical protein